LQRSAVSPIVRRINLFLGLVPHLNTRILPPRPFAGRPLHLASGKPNDNFPHPYDDPVNNDNDLLLSNPRTVSYPMSLNLENRKYIITKFIAQGADGAVYDGYYQDGNKTNEAIFKVYTGGIFFNHPGNPKMEYFNNEKKALSKLGRLIDVDEKNMILVMHKISGTTLKDMLRKIQTSMTENDQDSQEVLKVLLQKYLRLPRDFRQKWGMAHMDIHPVNVIVDDAGDMHLIDFAKTRELKGNPQDNKLESNLDDLYAKLGAAIHFKIPVEEIEFEN
jgi:serine/threonine protein kinase